MVGVLFKALGVRANKLAGLVAGVERAIHVAVKRLALSLREAQLLQLALQRLQHTLLLTDQRGDLTQRLEMRRLRLAADRQLASQVQQLVEPINAHADGLISSGADVSC